MTDIALRPRSPTELVDTAFQIFRREPAQFILAAALVYVPWLVVRLAFDLGVTTAVPPLPELFWTAVAGLAVYAIVAGAITQVASQVYLDQPVDLAAVFRTVGRRFVPLVLTTLITALFIIAGAMALLLPALYPLARFFAVRQSVMLENASVGGALGRSSSLSKGTKRHVLSTIFLAGVVTTAISLGAGLLISMIPSRVVVHVISTVISVVVYPFFGITETLLYYDVRIRREGFDIEYLAGHVDAAPAVVPGDIS